MWRMSRVCRAAGEHPSKVLDRQTPVDFVTASAQRQGVQLLKTQSRREHVLQDVTARHDALCEVVTGQLHMQLLQLASGRECCKCTGG
jgi:hypothetical protein